MTGMRNTFFHKWASERLGISAEDLSLLELEQLPSLIDLPEGPDSELGGETQSVLDTPTETELLGLARLGEELLETLPELPDGYEPTVAAERVTPVAC